MKTSQGSVYNLRGAIGPRCKYVIFSRAMNAQGGERCGRADGLTSEGFLSLVGAQPGLQWELRVR